MYDDDEDSLLSLEELAHLLTDLGFLLQPGRKCVWIYPPLAAFSTPLNPSNP